jgi:hypothetical protein
MDQQGARLSSETSKKIDRLTGWEEEPGWDTSTVVIGFQIVRADRNHVVVKYQVAGDLEDVVFNRRPRTEEIRFSLTQKRGGLRIVDPLLNPHVSPDALVKHLERLVAMEGAESRQRWASTIQQLKSLQTNGK